MVLSLRGRRDRSRAQSFGLVEEKKPRGEWGGDALKKPVENARLLAASALASRGFGARFSRLRRQNYGRKYNGGFAAKTTRANKLRAQIQFRQLRRLRGTRFNHSWVGMRCTDHSSRIIEAKSFDSLLDICLPV